MSSFKFTLFESQDLLYTQYFGILEVEDIQQCVQQGNALYPGLDSLVDLTEASMVNIKYKDMEALVQVAIEHEPRNIFAAYVAPGDLEFGLVRMFDARVDTALPQNRAVFRNLKEAQAWLSEKGGMARNIA